MSAQATQRSLKEDLRQIRSDQYVERCERRFEIEDSDLKVGIIRKNAEGEDDHLLVGTALDLSSRGVKLEVNKSLAFGEKVSLSFWSDAAELDFMVDAEIRWFRKLPKAESWVAGCLIEEPLPAETIQALARTHAIDRRQSRRCEIEFHAYALLATENEPFQIVMLDYSDAGVRLLSSASVPADVPLKILLPIDDQSDHHVEIQATTRWSRSFDCGYLVGCEIASTSQSRFRECADWLESSGKREAWKFFNLSTAAKAIVFFLTLILAYAVVSAL